jgi:hypothetical protein
MDFFVLREDYTIEVNKPEILLIKEFDELFSLKFNTGMKGDSDGRKRLKGLKVIAFIYLVYDWKSPYAEYSQKEKVDSALEDTDLEKSIVDDTLVIKAISKFQDLQDTRLIRLLKSSELVVDKIRYHFETLDLQERDEVTGQYFIKARDVMSNLAALGKTIESLQLLKHLVQKEQEQTRGLRGDAEPGMFD